MVDLHNATAAAHDASVRQPFSTVVRELCDLLGARLTAYLGSVKETRAVREWATDHRRPPAEVKRRLRLAYHVALIVSQRNSAGVTQAWFQGMNPALNDWSPARVIREEDPDQAGPLLIAAAREFAQHG